MAARKPKRQSSDKTDTPTRARARPLTPAQRSGFLAALAEGQTVSGAARQAGIVRRQALYELRARNEKFADEWDAAYEEGVQVLEQEAWRRAVKGVEDFRLDKEGCEHPIRVYSDTLLMFLMKAKRPGVYREHFKHEHEHRGRVDLRLDRLTDRELDHLETLVAKASE